MEQEKIGELLKSLRKQRGKTQEEVASDLFVSQKTISRWESGECLPDISIICDVAKYYGITVDELLNGSINKPNENIINSYEKENTNFLKQHLFKHLNVYLIVSLSILSVCILISTILLFTVNNEYISLFIIVFGLLGSLLIYFIGYKDASSKISDEKDLENIVGFKKALRKKLVFFLDIFVVIAALALFVVYYMLFYNIVEDNFLYWNISSAYLIIGLVVSYYVMRSIILDINFNKEKFLNKLSILFLIYFLIPVIFFMQVFVSNSNINDNIIITSEQTTLALFLITAYPNVTNILSIVLFLALLITSILLICLKKNVFSMIATTLLFIPPIISAVNVFNLNQDIVTAFLDYGLSVIGFVLAITTVIIYIVCKYKIKNTNTESL